MVTTTMSLSLITLFFFLLVSTVPVTSSGEWCVAKDDATDAQLQATIDWCCSDSGGFRDCTTIQPGGVCYEPNTLRDHASFVMNLYYQNLGHTKKQCDFSGTGDVVHHNPSHGPCVYVSY
ncbi:Carbohydrate-binding X8 domain superfamily protein [Raphanus sativus]|uniref:Major pollen allergen Ole e 10-like n=1 Tax=Raphanus sativus TaxID=3726 RepID=A0A6J0NY40_RAPSA|nr:major pollen allergen Ole e 10-like [Raphanus sativus]KAJ4897366.1 Carbohydrate-binding X8 domain superfamily protein [Raphanus sativus]